MSIVQRTRRRIKARSQWPAPPSHTQAPIDEGEHEYLSSINRIGCVGDCPVSAYDLTPSLPAAEWVLGQVGWHQHQHEEHAGLGAHHLVAGELLALARTLAGQNASGVLGYVPHYVPVPDPAAYRANELAYEIATAAALYYPYDSAVRRLAARALTRLADLVRMCGSQTAAEFLEDEATFRSASIDAMMEATAYTSDDL